MGEPDPALDMQTGLMTTLVARRERPREVGRAAGGKASFFHGGDVSEKFLENFDQFFVFLRNIDCPVNFEIQRIRGSEGSTDFRVIGMKHKKL